jgi:ABC-type transporter MlaC component
MNKDDIKQFIRAFMDFSKHAEAQEIYHNAKQEYLNYELRKQNSKMIIESEIEKKAAALEVTVDYYMAEFM